MVSQSIIPNSLLPLNAVRLGRFTLNTRHPNQDFIDPPSSPPLEQITSLSLDSWQEILTSSRATQLRNRLTSLLKFSFSNASNNRITLSALRATTYTLENSGKWFHEAIASPETRKWLESAIEDGAQGLYLVIGYHTLSDAKYQKVAISGGGFAADSSLSMANMVPAADEANSESPARVDLTTSLGAGIRMQQMQQSGFEIPGEHIYAVQYRKLKFKWYSSKNLDHRILEKNNRWKVYWEVRGDDEQEDDVLELVFADHLDEEKTDGKLGEPSGDEVLELGLEEDQDEEQVPVNNYMTDNGGAEYVF